MRVLLTILALAAVAMAQPGWPFVSVQEARDQIARSQTRLGDFEAVDLNGRVWRAAGLHGKVTVADIWATSCGPAGQRWTG
jgi:hypothetical protein